MCFACWPERANASNFQFNGALIDMAKDAVIRNVEIIGEASHNIEQHYPADTGLRQARDER